MGIYSYLVTSFTLVWIKINKSFFVAGGIPVTSFTLVWIKILKIHTILKRLLVTSFTLVWIKIRFPRNRKSDSRGHELHARVD